MKKIHSFHEVFDSQKLFRLILNAMANPAKEAAVSEFTQKLFGCAPDFLAVAMTLLDNKVSFYCDNGTLSEEIVSLTLAKPETAETADYIFIGEPSALREHIERAKCGTLRDPHKSATLIVRTDEPCDRQLVLSGPGIDGEIQVLTSKTVQDALALRDAQCYEYPQGIDFIFLSSDGCLFAVPRLISWEVR
jgi:alpha-D-ribose 1-methylphosphonate 5-triphosphate synthase subunit PhnH